MSETIIWECNFWLYSLAAGVFMSFVYDMIRIFRKLIPHNYLFSDACNDGDVPNFIFKNINIFKKLLKNIEEGQVFAREEEVAWVCQECGHIHYGKKAPKVCPACLHEQGYFISEGTISRCDTNEGFCEYSVIDD